MASGSDPHFDVREFRGLLAKSRGFVKDISLTELLRKVPVSPMAISLWRRHYAPDRGVVSRVLTRAGTRP
jgi:hypothetical protein